MLRNLLGRARQNTTKSPAKRAAPCNAPSDAEAAEFAAASTAGAPGDGKRAHPYPPAMLQGLKEVSHRVLGDGNLQRLVLLPEGQHALEWIACHTADFHTHLSLLFSLASPHVCTRESCPMMHAGPSHEYYWSPSESTLKKPLALTAPDYITSLLAWAKGLLQDEHLYPTRSGVEFPTRTFLPTTRTLLRRLSRIYGHLYHAHFEHYVALKQEAHLNTSFKHFYYFCREFDLVPEEEFAPLRPVIDQF